MTLAHVDVDESGWVGVSFDLAMLADFAPTDRRLATPAERERAPELSARMLGRASDGFLPEIERELKRRVAGGGLRAGDP